MCAVPTPHGRISFAAYGRRSIMAPPWFMSRQNRIHGSANSLIVRSTALPSSASLWRYSGAISGRWITVR